MKNEKVEEHVKNLEEVFGVWRKFEVKLNPKKFMFGVAASKFLGFIVSQRGTEANPKKIKVIMSMPFLNIVRVMQWLTSRIITLNHFMPKSTDGYLPFFRLLKKIKSFE